VFAGLSASLSGDRERGGGTIAGRLGEPATEVDGPRCEDGAAWEARDAAGLDAVSR
jgi:hypothetical protein